MYKIVRESDGSVRQIAPNKTANNLISKDTSPNLSLATTEAVDYYEKETTSYDRIYYVLDGTLVLAINGEKSSVQKGDACFISKDTTYEMQGTFKAVIVNQPAFGSEV